MKPITISIQGSYWDSQIYSGELMLLHDDGTISRIDWKRAVDALAKKHENIQTAVRLAFAESDWFYNDQTQRLLLDPEVEVIVKKQLATLANKPKLEVGKRAWLDYWNTEDSPFDFMPIDTEVYKNRVFAAGDEGLFSVARGSLRSGNGIEKHHDVRLFQVRASDGYKAVAAAGGAEGLFEFEIKINTKDELGPGKLLSKRSCVACDWAFQSVVGWGGDAAFFASFAERKEGLSSKVFRSAGEVFDFDDLFANIQDGQSRRNLGTTQLNYSWGSREKLYRATNWGIEVTDYFGHGWIKKPEQKMTDEELAKRPFTWRGMIPIKIDPDNIISTGTAPFGTVIEEQDKLTVIRSDGELHEFAGEVVHWRVFPRSTHYSNQLHIIYDDHMEVVSFVHDYFVNQENKLSGFARG